MRRELESLVPSHWGEGQGEGKVFVQEVCWLFDRFLILLGLVQLMQRWKLFQVGKCFHLCV